MNIRVVGHSCGKSGLPYLMPNSGQSVLKRWPGLGPIPWAVWERLEITVSDEPPPNQGIDGISNRSDLFRPASLPGLRLFDPQELFSNAKSILNSPPVLIARDDELRGQPEVGREEVVVFFNPCGVAKDDQPNVSARQDLVPDYMLDDDQPAALFPPLDGLDRPPVGCLGGNLFRSGEPLSARPGPTFLPRSLPGRLPVDGSIASNSTDQMNTRGKPPRQRCIEAVCGEIDGSAWEPVRHVQEHVAHQVQNRLSQLLIGTLAIETHVGRQSKRLSAPGGYEFEAQQNDLKTPDVHDLLGGRANVIPACLGAIDLAARFLVNGVIANQPENVGVTEQGHECPGQGLEKRGNCPCPGAEPTMIGIMGTASLGIAKLVDRRHKTTARAKDPALDDVLHQNPGRLGENCMKGLDKFPQQWYPDHGRSSLLGFCIY